MKFLTLLTLFTTLFLGVKSEMICTELAHNLASEAFQKIPSILGEHADSSFMSILENPETRLKSTLQLKSILQACLSRAKNVFKGIDSDDYKTILDLQKRANELNKFEDVSFALFEGFKKYSKSPKDFTSYEAFKKYSKSPKRKLEYFTNKVYRARDRVTFNPEIEVVKEFKSDVPVSEMFGKSLDSVGKAAKSAANKVTSNVAEISTKNVIGNIADKCTRSGCKQVTTAAKKTAKEVTKKSGSKLFEKLGTAVTIGLAAYEAYGEYNENGDVGRAVVRTTASLGKNSLISAAMIPVSALCGPFATACFIGGTVGISSYTPDAKWVSDKLYE